MQRSRERLLTAAERGHRGLLRLCPRPFRDRYGDEIARAFSEMARERYRRAGLRGLAALELRTLADTLATAWREHRDNLGATRGRRSRRSTLSRRWPTCARWTRSAATPWSRHG